MVNKYSSPDEKLVDKVVGESVELSGSIERQIQLAIECLSPCGEGKSRRLREIIREAAIAGFHEGVVAQQSPNGVQILQMKLKKYVDRADDERRN